MPNYEEIIQQSQANVNSLSEKLKDLDKLHQDIKELINQPEIFDSKYQQIVKLSEDYTNTLGTATKKYLDGNNTLFTTKLSELSTKVKDFEKEIVRLVNTDFNKLFKDLQKVFIDQTSEDLEKELKRFEDKSKDLQNIINELRMQVERLESIDLLHHFDKLQKTLAEIFGAINAINLTLTNIIQTLTGIVQSLGTIQTSIDTYHKATSKQLDELSIEAKKNTEFIESKIKGLADQNEIIIKEIKTNKLIQFIGLSLTLIILIYLIYKL
jgi:DNA repair exonuclease SbcCD ATPase subunit